MTNVFIFHGSYGNPQGNWFPWLKEELEKLNCQVFVPQFPSPQGQNLKNWFKVFDNYQKYVDENCIMVGHSLGSAFILSILETIQKRQRTGSTCYNRSNLSHNPIKAAFLISPFIELLGLPKFDKVNQTFVCKSFNWEKIKKNCQEFYAIHGDNDPYVPASKAEKVAEKLGEEIILIKEGGHLNKDAGFTKFEFLLEKIKKEI